MGQIHQGQSLRHTILTRTDDLYDDIEDEHGELVPTAQSTISEPLAVASLADGMSNTQIDQLQGEGIDPWADAHDGSTAHTGNSMALPTMLIAARFAILLDDPKVFAALTAPQALTLLHFSVEEDRAFVSAELPKVLAHLSRVQSTDRDCNWRAIEIINLNNFNASNSTRQRRLEEFHGSIEEDIVKGKTIVALATGPEDLPNNGRTICTQELALPPLNADMIIEILRQSHSLTGKLSGDAIRSRLPSDADLATMPATLVSHAFHSATTLTVADRLRTLSEACNINRPSGDLTLDDIYLPQAAKDDMEQLLSDLAEWKTGQLDWSEVTSSALLFGPPGNGKTRLASALAGAAGISLISTSYAECQKHGHQGDFLCALSERVEEAIQNAPAILFIDELDSFTSRTSKSNKSNYVVGIVNGLLEHLTQLNKAPGVIVVGATNHPTKIDPAVIRPGRFDLKIALDNPDQNGIKAILKIALGTDAGRLALDNAAERLIGTSGAQVAAVVRDARGKARRERTPLSDHHLQAAINRVAPAGCDAALRRIAIHESGHAVVAHRLGQPLPRWVRVTAKGGEYFGTGQDLFTKQSAQDRIAVILGGRAAEDICLGEVSNGAEDDLAQATNLAFDVRHRWGLQADNLMSLSLTKRQDLDPCSQFGTLINRDLNAQYTRAKKIVGDNQELVEHLARELIKHRELAGNEIAELFRTQTKNSGNATNPTQAAPSLH